MCLQVNYVIMMHSKTRRYLDVTSTLVFFLMPKWIPITTKGICVPIHIFHAHEKKLAHTNETNITQGVRDGNCFVDKISMEGEKRCWDRMACLELWSCIYLMEMASKFTFMSWKWLRKLTPFLPVTYHNTHPQTLSSSYGYPSFVSVTLST